jgi:LL-diaminopimelate aminotransferase
MTIEPANRMAELPPSFFQTLNARLRRLQAAKVDVIRMDMGSPDLPPAPQVIGTLQRSASEPGHHGYMPFGGLPDYRAAWANFYGRRFGVELDPDTELMGLLGSKEGIFKLPMAYVNPGDVVLVPDPGYITYTAGARFAGGEVVHMPLPPENHYLPDLKALPADLLRRTKMMWLNYPNNPTGAVAPLEFFAEAIELALEHKFLLAHDAPYTEITYDGSKAPSVLQVPRARETAVEFHSLSKTANMGGWRVGVMCGSADAVKTMSTLQGNADSGSFRPILDAAAVALNLDEDWLAKRNECYRERRDLVVDGLRAAGLTTETPAAAIYVWARLPEGEDDVDYTTTLVTTAGVSVTPGSFFGPSGRGYVRISLGTPTPRVAEAMQRWLEWSKARQASQV